MATRETNERKTSLPERVLSVILALLLALSSFSADGTMAIAGEITGQTTAQEQEQEATQESASASTQEQGQTPAPAETQEPAATQKPTETQTPAEAQPQPQEETQVPVQGQTATQEPKLASTREQSQTEISFSSYQNKDLEIYNYLHYTNANGEVTNSSGSYRIGGENTAEGRNIVIGNHAVEEENNTKPLDADIPISLKALNMAGGITVKPVGTSVDGVYKHETKLTVSEASTLGNLTVEENAKLDIVLNEALTVTGDIMLGKNSTLTITGTGKLEAKGTFASQGTVALDGGIIQANRGVSAKNLSLANTTLNANGGAISAIDALSMENSTVQNASLFGYKASGEGVGADAKTLSLSGNNTFSSVTAVGCEEGSALKVSIEGIETVSSSNTTTYYQDYTIAYQSEGAAITPQNDWPIAYRVSSTIAGFNNAAIKGYHTAEGYKLASTVPLPKDHLKPGYALKGWKLGDSETPVNEIAAANGNITLSAAFEPGAVTVKLNLGFDPTSYTNDKDADGKLPERESVIESKLDATVLLPVPSRFGYKFKGWRVVNSTENKTLSYAGSTEMPYQIAMADCVLENEQSVVSMEAQWEADKFGLTLFLGTSVENADDLLISVDGGTSFKKLAELNTTGVTVKDRSINFDSSITYGETIGTYLKKIFTDLPEGTLPVLKDETTGGSKQNFSGWSSAMGAVSGTTVFCYGEGGMLTPGGKKLADYQRDLYQNNAAINAVWGVMSYGLELPNTLPDGWSLSYIGSDGIRRNIESRQSAGIIQVQQDSAVMLTTSATSPKNFSLWDFEKSADNGKIMPEEQPYNPGDQKITYQFTMPAANVTATYNKGKEIWVDIAKSPIKFEENVSHNNRTVKGFWYADLIDGLTPLFQDKTATLSGTKTDGTTPLTAGTYFYQWDFADKFYVTSNKVGTKNQLTLINALTSGVYFKNVNLAMRDAYVNETNGSLIGGVDCESAVNGIEPETVAGELANRNVNLPDYANIVIDISAHSSYTTKLIFQGQENTVGAIMHGTLQAANKSPLTIKGEGKSKNTVNLGTVFGNFEYSVSGITVNEYKKDVSKKDFKYLFYCANQSGCQVANADIKAPSKNIHAGHLTGEPAKVSFTNCNVDIFSICVFQGIDVYGSYMRVRENLRFGSLPIYLANNAKVVIDGNLEMNYHHWADSDASNNRGLTDDTNNLLIVKGTFCDISNRTWQSGTLICNMLVLGRVGGIKGGTVIANQITNQAVGFWKYDSKNHEYVYDPVGNDQTVEANSNNDDYPFLVYHHNNGQLNTYTFSGGKIYLLGHYKTANGKYDSSVKATDTDNPVAQFMTPLFDDNGDLKVNSSINTTGVENAVKNSTLTSNECVVLGNSSDYYSKRRSVEISGAKFYAAGNITFYNDTSVSGGTIFCNGSFGSKGDLVIINSNITADAVGNAYNLKTTLADGTIRWKRTDIQGGTVTANRIGAFEKRVSDTAAPTDVAQRPKGTVSIEAGTTINAPGENNVPGEPTDTSIVHDVYINYIFDKNLFNNSGTPTNQNTLRFETTWQEGKTFADQIWANDPLSFTPPNVVDGGIGGWNWDSLTGGSVNAISNVGIAQKDDTALTENQKAFDRIQMKLYAVKDKYNLVFKAGADQITDIACDGTTVTKTPDKGETVTAPVTANKEVVLTFKDASKAADKSVIWYIDGLDIIHSVKPIVNGDTVSFTMPCSDVEVYVADEISLDLDKTSYTLLQDGFRTEANETSERDDSTFRYLGNLVIHQGSITNDIKFNIDDFVSYQMSEPEKGKETKNKILVDDAFDNSTNNRTVTLRRIYQNGTPTSFGVDLEDGANANFLVDGAIRLCRVSVPEKAKFSLTGKNNDRTKDAFYPFVNGDALKKDNWASVGNWYGKAGDITLEGLTILGRSQGMYGSLCYSRDSSTNTVRYTNCRYKSAMKRGKDDPSYRGWYNRSYFAYNAGNVIFNNTQIALWVSKDWPGYFCDKSNSVTICNNSVITVKDSGATETDPSNTFYARIKNGLKIENATLALSLRVPVPTDDKTYRVRLNKGDLPDIELKGAAQLTLEQHALLKKLVVGGASTVNVGQTGTGYLLCGNIEVNDTAKLNAGGIAVSGFYDGSTELQTESDFHKAMGEGRYIYDGSSGTGLVVNGGTVTAKEYITGDVNGKIAVNGGIVTAPAIGTTGKLYGYTQYVPREGEKYIYTYDRIPEGATVNITGGQVHVLNGSAGIPGYLGGMKTKVTISGGAVHLADNAVLGLTEKQQTTLTNYATSHGQSLANFGSLTMTGGSIEGAVSGAGDAQNGGSILMPYGTVNISGENTAINVYNMMSYCGEMTISGVTRKAHANPYAGSDKISDHEKLGIYVAHRMSAKNLTITKGSVVYANSAYANVVKGETGKITVTVDGVDRAYLYTTNAYGVIGEGNSSYEYNDGTGGQQGITPTGAKNVFGTKVVDVHYSAQLQGALLDEDVDKVKNPNLSQTDGLPYYTVVAAGASDDVRYYNLKNASCSGYEFLGWYEYDPQTNQFKNDTRVERIDKTNSSAIYLGAKWKKVTVAFEVQIELTDEKEFNPDTMDAVSGAQNLYKFKHPASVTYGDSILSSDGVLLQNYTTNTLGVLEVSYNGEAVQHSDRVTSAMADAYVNGKSQPLVLTVTSTQIEKILITLDQNKKDKGRPQDAVFNLTSTGDLFSGSNTSNQVAVYESITSSLGGIAQFAVAGESSGEDGLINPSAPGYTFGGWYTDKECTSNKVTSTTTLKSLHEAKATTLYAKWTPNVYMVRFSAAVGKDESLSDSEQRWVTKDNVAPAADDSKVLSMDYCWTYDSAPSSNGQNFWISGGSGPQYQQTLPYAWREGYVFEDCWQFVDKDKKIHEIRSTDELSTAVMENLDVEKQYTSDNSQVALTLYAKYRSVKVTYDLNGGKWIKTDTPLTSSPNYGDALAGYKKESELSALDNTHYAKLGKATSADSATEYCVVSTASDYFKNNYSEGGTSGYVAGDYRETLSRKGYTFQGWKKAEADGSGGGSEGAGATSSYYGCTPRFEDISLKAEWSPNTYNLKLHVKDEGYVDTANSKSKYESNFNNPEPSTTTISNVTVGSEITATGTSSDSNGAWPDKTQWYAYNPDDQNATDDTKHRFMLGATFAALDPGDSTKTSEDSIYLGYASAVTNMLNSGTMFDNGGTFFLPEDEAYRKDVEAATASKNLTSFTVPDYPTGSEIDLYSVYRERSLVFIEQYVDGNGLTQSKVMHSSPWSSYSNYPFDESEAGYAKDPKSSHSELTDSGGGYALAGWYVGSSNINPSLAYNETNYTDNIATWKKDTSITNTYDINVYTAYVAQKAIEQELKASPNPSTDTEKSSASYTLPGSMQEGELSYTLGEITDAVGSGTLNLVSKEEMEKHQYDATWETGGVVCSADNTVAIELKLEKDGETASYTQDLEANGQSHKLGQAATGGQYQHIGKGWKLILTLYHSKVMTRDAEYTFIIDYKFEKNNGTNSENTLNDQWLKDTVTVKLTPSLYNVEYQANLPESEGNLKVLNSHDFASKGSADTYTYKAKQGYGSILLAGDSALELEGYELNKQQLPGSVDTAPQEGIWCYSDSESSATTPLKYLLLDGIFGPNSVTKANELKDGAVTLQADYVAKTYGLKKDGSLPDSSWAITYTDGVNDAEPGTAAFASVSENQVKYHSRVTFTPSANQPAEYITLTYVESGSTEPKAHRLDTCAEKQADGSYLFVMPASDVTISYNNVMDLYLDKGTIELFPDGFKQTANPMYGDKTIAWPGDYRIWQDENNNIYDSGDVKNFHPTENVLKITGDMTKRSDGSNANRTITLGNLNITSDNSIELAAANAPSNPTKVNLVQEGKIAAKNILVPANASLTLTGDYKVDSDQNSSITLAPAPDWAAIGAAQIGPQNGTITLNKVDVSMMLNAPSQSSGIGSGGQGTADSENPCGNVAITNSRITVKENASASGQYTGAWIGGSGVPTVTVTGTDLFEASSSQKNHGAKAIDGATVKLTNCTVGKSGEPVKEPIHAVSALSISECSVYQQNEFNLGAISMFGTDNGTTNVVNSAVQISYTGNGFTDKLFTGQLVINDARSDVTINGTQIVEVSNGNIKIETSKITQSVPNAQGAQDEVSHEHGDLHLNYLLLEEGTLPSPAPNLTVASLGDSKTIAVQQPKDTSKNVTIGKLDVQDDAKIVLNGNLIVSGGEASGGETDGASIAAGKTLTVESTPKPTGGATEDAGGYYGVTYQKGLTGDGNYVQVGGSLIAKTAEGATDRADVVVKGNMTLTNVTADCTGSAIGSNGGSPAIAGSGGTAGSPSTATTVTINGGDVAAATIGACGEQNSTFTFVKLGKASESGIAPKLEGKLVQDHYRLKYEVGSLNVELKDTSDKPLPTVLRTETTYNNDGATEDTVVRDAVPAHPTGDSDASTFKCWYIWDENGTKRLALLRSETNKPSGLGNVTQLGATTKSKGMSSPASDGTQTLSVYAWQDVSGTACIEEGRLFKSWTSTGKTASISQRGAWTAVLKSNATYIAGRDYQVSFEKGLPVGTDLTLTVVTGENEPYEHYHYTVSDSATGATTVKFSDFTKMGTTQGPSPQSAFAGSNVAEETFLLSADFGELASSATPPGGNVTFSVLLEDNTKVGFDGNAAEVSYDVASLADGVLSVDSDNSISVTTSPSGDARYKNKKVYLVGTLGKKDDPADASAFKAPLDASASLTPSGSGSVTAINGTWISGSTVAFDLGTYGDNNIKNSYKFAFDGLPKTESDVTYNIEWKLCAGDAQNVPNITNNVCSNTAQSSLTAPAATPPSLAVTCEQPSRVLFANGTGTSQQITFNYETNQPAFTVVVEKQTGLTAFESVENPQQTISPTSGADALGTVSVNLPNDVGIYRVKFSLADGSKNDDVYYTFIVRERIEGLDAA